MSFAVEAFLRVAGAIVLDTLAFAVWNVGTRSPARVLRDIRDHVREQRALIAGTLRAIIGAVFLSASVVLLLPAVVDLPRDFAWSELFVVLVALALEHVVGEDLRALTIARRSA